MNTRLLIPLLLAGAVALACASRSPSDTGVRSASARSVAAFHALSQPAVHTPAPAPVRRAATADTMPARIAPAFVVTTQDRSLRFTLAIRNEGKKHIELAFPSGQTYDFAVLNDHGKEVYRWSKDRMFTQSRQNRMLDGGDTLRIEESASPELAPGSYVAVATLHSSNFPVQQHVAFQLR